MLTVDDKTHAAIATLLRLLPGMAGALIRKHHDMDLEVNRAFAASPDSPAMHQPLWHQYGIITHSKRFQAFLEHEIPGYLKQWGVLPAVESYFETDYDGWSKWQLLQIVAIVHDIGKFTAREVWEQPDGTVGRRFTGHESHSGTLLRGEARRLLVEAGLTTAQIEYVAACAERHFDLGIVREAAKPNYTITFTKTGEFRAEVEKILRTHPELALEIFLCFLADSLSKTDVFATAETDAAISPQASKLEVQLKRKQLPSELLGGALQMPVNVMVAKNAVLLWASRQP